MITKYIKCPKLISEGRELAKSDINKYIDYLEKRRYSQGTITAYVSSVIHYLSWRRRVEKKPSKSITNKNIQSFLFRHLKKCKCPSSFHRGRASCSASIRLWRKLITEQVHITTNEDHSITLKENTQ